MMSIVNVARKLCRICLGRHILAGEGVVAAGLLGLEELGPLGRRGRLVQMVLRRIRGQLDQ